MIVSTNSSEITKIPERYSEEIYINQMESENMLKKLEGFESSINMSNKEIISDLLKKTDSSNLSVSEDFLLTIEKIKVEKSEKIKNTFPKPSFKKKKKIDYKI